MRCKTSITLILFINVFHSGFLAEFHIVSTTSPPQTDTQNNVNYRLSTLETKLQQLMGEDNVKSGPKNCQEIKNNNDTLPSGIYLIHPDHSAEGFLVVCDMEREGGGWTYLLNRFNGSQTFYLDWLQYKYGFGNLLAEFWLGLEHLYQLTGTEVNELLVELVDWDSNKVYAHYAMFSLGSEKEDYSLKVLGGYKGTAGDSLTYSAGAGFTTRDHDRDIDNGNCATFHEGAWWYKNCMKSHLTGKYLNGKSITKYKLMYWESFRGTSYSLKEARMMVRPRKQKGPVVLSNGK